MSIYVSILNTFVSFVYGVLFAEPSFANGFLSGGLISGMLVCGRGLSVTVADRGPSAGLIVDVADQLAGIYHIIHIPPDGDPGKMDLFGQLLAGKEIVWMVF